MQANQVANLLKGKTISRVSFGEYIGWVALNEIEFTDGTVMELGGNADIAYITDITLPDGSYITVDDPEYDRHKW